jgi:NAD(P)-dependent dehydrogenase (short-subunit alcohol dehydrogenase family)
VITVDQRDADIVADLGTPDGRKLAVDAIAERSGGVLHGFVPFAGVGPLPGRLGSILIRVNYFGTVEMLEALRPLLAAGEDAAAVAISSNSTTCQPGIPPDLIEACLAGDEAAAVALADEQYDSIVAYPSSKVAVARWVRSHATTPEWAGEGITLNAVAPGMIDTAMVAEGKADPDLGPLLEAFTMPVGRSGRPEEIAALVAFLLGPDARFFCGSLIFCDGGTDAMIHPHDHPSPWNP